MGRKVQRGPLKNKKHQKWRNDNAHMLKAWEKYGDIEAVARKIGMPVYFVRYGLWRLWGVGSEGK